MNKYTIRLDVIHNRYTIDNEEELLIVCPCCGKYFDTQESAQTVAERIAEIPVEWDFVMYLQRLWLTEKGDSK